MVTPNLGAASLSDSLFSFELLFHSDLLTNNLNKLARSIVRIYTNNRTSVAFHFKRTNELIEAVFVRIFVEIVEIVYIVLRLKF